MLQGPVAACHIHWSQSEHKMVSVTVPTCASGQACCSFDARPMLSHLQSLLQLYVLAAKYMLDFLHPCIKQSAAVHPSHIQYAACAWCCLQVSDSTAGAAISEPASERTKSQKRSDRKRQQKAAARGPDWVAPVVREVIDINASYCLSQM